MVEIEIDSNMEIDDTLRVSVDFTQDQADFYLNMYGLTLMDLVFNAINEKLLYLYEQHLRGQEETPRDPVEPPHSAERPIH